MIYCLTGKILEKSGTEAVIECGGVGYLVKVPTPALGALPQIGQVGTLYTHMNVTENDVSLFGFASVEERNMFLMLTGVTGVGPKAGISVLSALSVGQIALAASAGDYKAFTAANGVGPKLAQRIVLEIKDKVSGANFATAATGFGGISQAAFTAGAASQAVAALLALGYSQSQAAAAVAPLDNTLPVSEIVRLALREMGKR